MWNGGSDQRFIEWVAPRKNPVLRAPLEDHEPGPQEEEEVDAAEKRIGQIDSTEFCDWNETSVHWDRGNRIGEGI